MYREEESYMGADVRFIGSLMVRHTVYIIKCLFCFLLFFWRRLLATVRGFCVQFGSAFSFATDKMFQPPTRVAATDIATSNRQVNGVVHVRIKVNRRK